MIADLPPGAVAVIFHSVRHAIDDEGYAEMAARMEVLAAQQPGYLGVRSVRDPQTREGITVSYWRDLESIAAWKANAAHREAQRQGDDPANDGDGDGPAQAGDEPVQVDLAADAGGLEEDAPVPVVVHAGCPLREGTICCASALLR